MGKSGIYGIFNLISGKVYIGSAINLKQRLRQHKEHLEKQIHCNIYLQNAWNKYGENSFGFYVLEHCSKEQLINREQYYLDSLKSYDTEFGYNICKIAGSTIGQKPWLNKRHTEETKKKISKGNIGKRLSEEAKRIISFKNKGNIRSKEWKQKMSEKMKGRIISDETKKKITFRALGNQRCLGRKLSAETKNKISIANKVRFLNNPLLRQKYSKIHKGKIVSDKTRQKLSEVNKGKRLGWKHSDESKKKMSEALKRSWQNRKNLILKVV